MLHCANLNYFTTVFEAEEEEETQNLLLQYLRLRPKESDETSAMVPPGTELGSN